MDGFEEATFWNVWREEPAGWMNDAGPGFWEPVQDEKQARLLKRRAPEIFTKLRKQTRYIGPWEEVD